MSGRIKGATRIKSKRSRIDIMHNIMMTANKHYSKHDESAMMKRCKQQHRREREMETERDGSE